MKQKRSYKRTERVGQQLHEVIAGLLLTDADDPRLQMVQVTAVEMSPDLRYAKVFFIMLDGEEPEDGVEPALERFAGFAQRSIGEQLRLQFVPRLTFKFDEAVMRGRAMDELLAKLPGNSET